MEKKTLTVQYFSMFFLGKIRKCYQTLKYVGDKLYFSSFIHTHFMKYYIDNISQLESQINFLDFKTSNYHRPFPIRTLFVFKIGNKKNVQKNIVKK